jgi:hypothetical protein
LRLRSILGGSGEVKVAVEVEVAVKAEADSCVLAKDIEVNELGVWLPGRLLNVSLMMCKGIEAYL